MTLADVADVIASTAVARHAEVAVFFTRFVDMAPWKYATIFRSYRGFICPRALNMFWSYRRLCFPTCFNSWHSTMKVHEMFQSSCKLYFPTCFICWRGTVKVHNMFRSCLGLYFSICFNCWHGTMKVCDILWSFRDNFICENVCHNTVHCENVVATLFIARMFAAMMSIARYLLFAQNTIKTIYFHGFFSLICTCDLFLGKRRKTKKYHMFV